MKLKKPVSATAYERTVVARQLNCSMRSLARKLVLRLELCEKAVACRAERPSESKLDRVIRDNMLRRYRRRCWIAREAAKALIEDRAEVLAKRIPFGTSGIANQKFDEILQDLAVLGQLVGELATIAASGPQHTEPKEA